jgi:hypothetical protein
VAIKAFFGDDLKVNFFGKLATDSHVQARAGGSGARGARSRLRGVASQGLAACGWTK